MNNKQARKLRKQADSLAVIADETTNINIDIKAMPNGKWVKNEKGKMVEEMVPITTYTTVYKQDCPRVIYQALKLLYKRGELV